MARQRDQCAGLEARLSQAQEQQRQQAVRLTDLQTRLGEARSEVSRPGAPLAQLNCVQQGCRAAKGGGKQYCDNSNL